MKPKTIFSYKIELLPNDMASFQILEQDERLFGKLTHGIFGRFEIRSSSFPEITSNAIYIMGFRKEHDNRKATFPASKIPYIHKSIELWMKSIDKNVKIVRS